MILSSNKLKNLNVRDTKVSCLGMPKPKSRLFRRLLLKGFAFSIFFHAGLFLLFQIKSLTISNTASQPSTVYISPMDPFITILSGKRSQDEDPRRKYAQEFRLNSSFVQEPTPPLFLPPLSAAATSSEDYAPINPILPWSFTDEYAPSRQENKVYPIKITLHSSLRHLSFIDDASSLFTTSTAQTLLSTPMYAPAGPKLSFDIDVSPQTGKIQKILCTKEPFDKRIQVIAEQVLRKVQFYTSENALRKNVWSGEISIQFYGTYDTISPLLKKRGTSS